MKYAKTTTIGVPSKKINRGAIKKQKLGRFNSFFIEMNDLVTKNTLDNCLGNQLLVLIINFLSLFIVSLV